MSDPRRDPTVPPPGPKDTGVRKRAELQALPSRPPSESEGSDVLGFMLTLAQVARSDTQVLISQVDETLELSNRVIVEVDQLTGQVIRIEGKLDRTDAKVDRLEERTTIVSNQQIVQNARSEKLDDKIDKLQVVFEGALSRFDQRVGTVERRMDDLERRFQTFQELVTADIELRREQLNGTQTPRTQDGPSDPTSIEGQ